MHGGVRMNRRRDHIRSEYVANLTLEAQAARRIATEAQRLADQLSGGLTLASDEFDPQRPLATGTGRVWPGK